MRAAFTTALLIAILGGLHVRGADLPAPLPEFMDSSQTGKWMAAKAAATTSVAKASTQFYTGKPFVAAVAGYVFKYRTYDPEITRWTSADPSGFPDGANNLAYAAIPTSQIDPYGLITVNQSTFSTDANVRDELPGTLSWALYTGRSFATADGSRFPDTSDSASGDLVLSSSIIGAGAQAGNDAHVRVTIHVSIIPEVGLTFSPSDDPDSDINSVGTGISYTATGEHTRTLTIHARVAYALNAREVTGAGLGGSISFGRTSDTRSHGFGTYVFQE